VGASGSIGRQALEVCLRHADRLQVALLSVHRQVSVLPQLIAQFKPAAVCVTDSESASGFAPPGGVQYYRGGDGLRAGLEETAYDLLVNGIVGAAGLAPSFHALNTGRSVATANKESLVIGGSLLTATAREHDVEIRPIDSEHSALWQCLRSGRPEEVERLWLTASGGPFLKRPISTFATITRDEALGHPTWKMGAKITVDSATMMNKGFEIIEAHWLFGVPAENIEVVIHPESIVHSAVAFRDGSVVGQLGWPDMQLPIQYALLQPDRVGPAHKPLDLRKLGRLTFDAPDPERYPALGLARRALELGGAAPVILNAANEMAVMAFLAGGIPFPAISECVAAQLSTTTGGAPKSLQEIVQLDLTAREAAATWLLDQFSYRVRHPAAVYE
jgi:1-deoxy-D-xylulose-5-phosphate reductoisomerase